MNNFLFRPEFLLYSVDWDHVMDSSGKYYLKPGCEGDGLGHVRVDFEIIEHVKTNPSIFLERDAFTNLLNRLEAKMEFPPLEREIHFPLGFHPDFTLTGEPAQAIDRVRRRVAMKARLEDMHSGRPSGLEDPLYLCLYAQKEAVRDFMRCTNEYSNLFLGDLNEGTWDVELDSVINLDHSSRRAIKRVQWGSISFLGYDCGLTFTFHPYNSSTKRFYTIS